MIFLLVVEDEHGIDRVMLMNVCRRWYAIMLSTPGIPCALRIRNSTTMEMVRTATQGTRWLLTVLIAIDDESIEQDFNADIFDACFMAAIEEASRWKTLWIGSLPRIGKCKAFQIVPSLKNLEILGLEPGCHLGGFFEPLMTAITATATPHLTEMFLGDLNTVLYLVQPDCLTVFNHLLICLFFTHSGSLKQDSFILHFWLVRRSTGLRCAGYSHIGKIPY